MSEKSCPTQTPFIPPQSVALLQHGGRELIDPDRSLSICGSWSWSQGISFKSCFDSFQPLKFLPRLHRKWLPIQSDNFQTLTAFYYVLLLDGRAS